MSKSSSSSETGKWSYHFGLYRQTAQHAKEDFLKLSRARQMRRGWTCAAVSSLVVISVIVVILIIYDYAIVLESSVVQARENKGTDEPLGEFGLRGKNPNLNWKSYEKLNRHSPDLNFKTVSKLPQLVNSLEDANSTSSTQLNNNELYKNTSGINSSENIQSLPRRWTPTMRTSPRPFYYESKESTPAPFHKSPAITHPSWLENYRNMQRLKNLEKVIDYLKINHAKIKEKHGVGSEIYNITFSGIYIHPRKKENVNITTHLKNNVDVIGKSKNDNYKSNTMINGHAYQFDILRTYKPDNPADINLLTENNIKITSHKQNNDLKSFNKIPILGGIRHPSYDCSGENCFSNDNTKANFDLVDKEVLETAATVVSDSHNHIENKTKLLSVMLDIYPMEEKSEEFLKLPKSIIETIASTKAPFFHFRPRPNFYDHHSSPSNKRPFKTALRVNNRPSPFFFYNSVNTQIPSYYDLNRKHFLPNKEWDGAIKNKPTQMLVHLNVFPEKRIINDQLKSVNKFTSTTKASLLLSETTTKEPMSAIEIIKSNSFIISVNESTTNSPSKTGPQDLHFPTVLENARRINELQLLKPEYIPFELKDAKRPNENFGLETNLNNQVTLPTTTDHHQIKLTNEKINCSNKIELTNLDQSEIELADLAKLAPASVPINNGHYRNINFHSSKVMFATNENKNSRQIQNNTLFLSPRTKPYQIINRKSTID